MNTAAATIPERTRSERPVPQGRVFLSCQWRALAMLNWEVSPELVEPLVPRGTELDFHDGKTYISVVGFRFLDTRLLGMAIPWHRHFVEVNLRFYIRRHIGDETRRGVCFIREIAPRWAVSTVANWAYNEHYVTLPMRYEWKNFPLPDQTPPSETEAPLNSVAPQVTYQWRHRGEWCGMELTAGGNSAPLAADSHPEFIAEHYWGYSAQRDGGTLEYQVEHPSWQAWPGGDARLVGPIPDFYPRPFAETLSRPPDSAFLADGSLVNVYRPTRIA